MSKRGYLGALAASTIYAAAAGAFVAPAAARPPIIEEPATIENPDPVRYRYAAPSGTQERWTGVSARLKDAQNFSFDDYSTYQP
jgi:hypothetical protein